MCSLCWRLRRLVPMLLSHRDCSRLSILLRTSREVQDTFRTDKVTNVVDVSSWMKVSRPSVWTFFRNWWLIFQILENKDIFNTFSHFNYVKSFWFFWWKHFWTFYSKNIWSFWKVKTVLESEDMFWTYIYVFLSRNDFGKVRLFLESFCIILWSPAETSLVR